MRISVNLSEEEARLLGAAAERLGIRPEGLVRAVLSDFLGEADDETQRVGEWILRQNKDLYRKLN